MAKRTANRAQPPRDVPDSPQPLHWLLCEFDPVSLFSLRMTHATSKGGKTLLVPTPYAFKLTLIDACFRCFPPMGALDAAHRVFHIVKSQHVRFRPPTDCVVQNTFMKIRQESREAPNGIYDSTIAYREWCFYRGTLTVAMTLRGCDAEATEALEHVSSHVTQIGKRGCFWQFLKSTRHTGDLPAGFTRQSSDDSPFDVSAYGVSQFLDDFGPKLLTAADGFERISSYHPSARITLGEHRVLTPTLIPYVQLRASRGFTQYRRT